jgi:hypothetical protein
MNERTMLLLSTQQQRQKETTTTTKNRHHRISGFGKPLVERFLKLNFQTTSAQLILPAADSD